MNNNFYNAIVFICSMIAFLVLIYLQVPWWAYLLFFIIVPELK